MKPGSAKTIVVTGANAGLGFQLSLALARTGAHVVMARQDLGRRLWSKSEALTGIRYL
jgi:NAD(P)-dependent dehydrogenase (short-subunit alcohol dehydrogenase family)